jgi:hypothetical protein
METVETAIDPELQFGKNKKYDQFITRVQRAIAYVFRSKIRSLYTSIYREGQQSFETLESSGIDV